MLTPFFYLSKSLSKLIPRPSNNQFIPIRIPGLLIKITNYRQPMMLPVLIIITHILCTSILIILRTICTTDTGIASGIRFEIIIGQVQIVFQLFIRTMLVGWHHIRISHINRYSVLENIGFEESFGLHIFIDYSRNRELCSRLPLDESSQLMSIECIHTLLHFPTSGSNPCSQLFR